jgi:hypothetical protein
VHKLIKRLSERKTVEGHSAISFVCCKCQRPRVDQHRRKTKTKTKTKTNISDKNLHHEGKCCD